MREYSFQSYKRKQELIESFFLSVSLDVGPNFLQKLSGTASKESVSAYSDITTF